MRIEIGSAHSSYPYVTVLADANELHCDRKALPYSTWIGTIRLDTLEIYVWHPAAYKPRGYRRAAVAMLEAAVEAIKAGTAVINQPTK